MQRRDFLSLGAVVGGGFYSLDVVMIQLQLRHRQIRNLIRVMHLHTMQKFV